MEEEWEQLRREARRLESNLEEKVAAYSRLAQRLNSDILYDTENPVDEASEQTLNHEIDALLVALSDCNNRMGACVSRGARTPNVAQLQRYREILFDYTTEFKNTSAQIQRRRESSQLFRRGGGGAASGAAAGLGADQDTEHLLRERNAIHSSLRSATGVLGQAQEAKESLRQQRTMLGATSSTLQAMSSQFPSINRVVEAIQRRRVRDNVIIGTVIAFCICFLLWWMFG